MELIVFIAFPLLMEVQSYKSPTVKVSPDVIRESSSVKISCETPADVIVDHCYFYTNREKKNIKNSWRCELDLTGAEVFRWAAVKSPESLNIYCYYIMHNKTSDNTSLHSPPATVMVKVSTSTSTTTKQTTTAMKTTLGLPVMSTSETITHSTTDLHSKTSPSTSMTKEMTTIFITNFTLPGNSTISEHTTTAITFTTTSPRTAVSGVHTSMANPDQQTDIWFTVLVSIAVTVILAGLTGFICLCRFASKKRKKQLIKTEVPSQGIGMSCSGPAEIYSLITSVPETSQAISGGLEHPESHQDSTANPTDAHSFIMSVNSIYQPSDVVVNKQQKQGNPEENENVYHLYSTIPDKPVHSDAEDHVYSLVKMY